MAGYTLERYEISGRWGRGGRLVAERGRSRRVTVDTPGSAAALNPQECRAFAAWLLVQAADMEAEARK